MNDSFHNCTKRSRFTATETMFPLTEQEILDNSSYIINAYSEMTDEELLSWQQALIMKSMHENKVNYLLDQLKNIESTNTRRCGHAVASRCNFSNGMMSRTRSLNFEDCAISMAIDNHGIGLQPVPTARTESDSIADLDRCSVADLVAPSERARTPEPEVEPEPIDHSNFMEAAVAVAIQEKGLSTSTVQVSPNR